MISCLYLCHKSFGQTKSMQLILRNPPERFACLSIPARAAKTRHNPVTGRLQEAEY